MSKNPALRFLAILRPFWLLNTAITYAIGTTIALYLGIPLNWNYLLLGIAWLFSLQLGGHGLDLYFTRPDSMRVNRTSNNQSLLAGIAALSTSALITISFVRSDILNTSTILIMVLLVGGMVVAVVPPPRLVENIYRELALSVLGVLLVPAFGFLLQAGSLHRFVAMSVFPLMLLHIAAQIIFKFPSFARDSLYEKKSILVHSGWQRGMNIVNILILSAFLLFGLAMLAGLPTSIVWPTFLVLPLALFQIWYLNRIAAGAKPLWRVLSVSAVSIYALTSYLLLFGFLTH
jgi:hypothetical protein